MFQIFRNLPLKEKYFLREKYQSDFIPYKCHWNKNTVITKNNELLQVIKIGGFSFETADDQDLDIRKTMRNTLFKNMSAGNIILYFHTIRRKKPLSAKSYDYNIDPTLKLSKDFVTYLKQEWQKKYSTFQSYANELYLTIMYQPDTGGVAILEYWYKTLMQKSVKNSWEKDMQDSFSALDEMSARVLNTFRDYDAELLEVKETKDGVYCEILEFLGTIINSGQSSKVLFPTSNLDKYLSTHRLFFKNKTINVRSPSHEKYAGIISIQEYGPSTNVGVFDGMLQAPFEFVMTQSFTSINRTVAVGKMQLQQNRLIQAGDKAVSQIVEISKALDLATSGDVGFGDHHLTVLCVADSEKELENNLSQTAVELSNCGIQPVRERINLEACYWGQLPGNISYIQRTATISTLNLASFASMHNYPVGQERNNHWGEYVTILDTTSNTPYYFNFHVRDVGHTLIIGPTGAGKTVLMNFLCAQAQKFKPRMYFFDKDHGAEIFIRALGGVYTEINPGEQCNFNPLQLPDNGENRNFLLTWLKLLVTANGETVNAEEIKLLSLAIEGNYRLNQKDRKLSNIVPFLGMETFGSLASRISMWHGRGSHARIFDNPTDNIDFTKARIFGFEMALLLKDKYSLGPVLSYIFHKINISLDGWPTMIVLDEAWALIDNPIFAPTIKDWLKVLRKLNTFVIFATQSVEDASKSQISDTLIQQTATQIFLPNLKATEVYRSAFMLSQREYQIIRTTDPGTRYFLVKQGLNAIVARVNLSGMNNIINVLSGRTDIILLLNEIIKEYGDDPEIWLPIFYKRVAANK
ncbi:MAG: VirB4 family type IV secretion/conjugal transfer ATPase [Rickettsiaceae bacterium]|nr:VirB4 family type IV secretion/conjugal transfer ATPase [Rickettsiaceae bacterium]